MLPVANPCYSSTVNSDAKKRLKQEHSSSCDTPVEELSLPSSGTEEHDPKAWNTKSPIHQEKLNNKSMEVSSPQKINISDGTIFITDDDGTDKIIPEYGDKNATSICPSSFSSVASCSSRIDNDPAGAAALPCSEPDSLPELVPSPGTEWRWQELPKRPYRQGATPAEMTAGAMDSSYLLNWLIDTMDS